MSVETYLYTIIIHEFHYTLTEETTINILYIRQYSWNCLPWFVNTTSTLRIMFVRHVALFSLFKLFRNNASFLSLFPQNYTLYTLSSVFTDKVQNLFLLFIKLSRHCFEMCMLAMEMTKTLHNYHKKITN